MRDAFPGYYPLDDATLDRLWNDGLVVLDANVLLDVFRVSEGGREELLTLFRVLRERLWVPHQAAEEFHRTVAGEVLAQSLRYGTARDALKRLRQDITGRRDHPFVAEDLMNRFETVADELDAELERLGKSTAQLVHDNPILEELADLLTGRVGEALSQAELDEIYREGKGRYEAKVPPGYEDQKKEPARAKYGDLVIWRQILKKAKDSSLPVIFVSRDKKEDWVRVVGGQSLGPRPELVLEFREVTGQSFHLYHTWRFLEYSRERLESGIQQKTVDEVRDLPPQDSRATESAVSDHPAFAGLPEDQREEIGIGIAALGQKYLDRYGSGRCPFTNQEEAVAYAFTAWKEGGVRGGDRAWTRIANAVSGEEADHILQLVGSVLKP